MNSQDRMCVACKEGRTPCEGLTVCHVPIRQARHTQFTSVSVTPDAREALRGLAVDLSTVLGRRVPLSEAVRIARGVVVHVSDSAIIDVVQALAVHDSFRSRDVAPPRTPDGPQGLPAW